MLKRLMKETGSALITAIIIVVIITATLLVFLAYSVQQTRFVQRKEHFLQAKYAAESGIHQSIAGLRSNWNQEIWKDNVDQRAAIAFGDSADIIQHPWGGFIYLKAGTQKKDQFYSLQTLVGSKLTPVFQSGVVINPRYYSLVVTGDTRLYCDVLVGKSGVKKEAFRGRPYTGDKVVYGNIVKTTIDQRPGINLDYIDFIFDDFSSFLLAANSSNFNDFIDRSSLEVDLSKAPNPVTISNEQINSRNWEIKGPATLIVNEPLTINSYVTLSNYLKIVCSEEISLQGFGAYKGVIFYSSKQITLSNIRQFEGQLFSEEGIVVKDNSKLTYSSLVMTYSANDTASVKILSGSEVSGSVVFLTRERSIVPTQQRGKVIVGENTMVSGLVFSDNLTTLQGKVNGTIITDRFHFYYSPTDYYNWIKDGIVNRKPPNDQFRLPIFFELSEKKFTPVLFE